MVVVLAASCDVVNIHMRLIWHDESLSFFNRTCSDTWKSKCWKFGVIIMCEDSCHGQTVVRAMMVVMRKLWRCCVCQTVS